MSAAQSRSGNSFQPPHVSPVRPSALLFLTQCHIGLAGADHQPQADIASFHQSHFSSDAICDFATHFLGPQYGPQSHFEEQHDDDEYMDEDDGLGYYPDGVKRTLTDEQIEIFRHSELESLRRVQAKAQDKLKTESAALLQAAKQAADSSESPDDAQEHATRSHRVGSEDCGSEDGEIESDTPKPVLSAAELKRQKRKRDRQNRQKKKERKFIPEPKEDLRKRTWDKVEAGMDSLDYGDLDDNRSATAGPAAQRRCISYDD